MFKLQVLSFLEFFLSHLFLIAGLVLVTIGLLNGNLVLTIIGIWIFMLGVCLGFTFTARKLYKQKSP